MTKLPLHRKYRPEKFEEMYGNETTIGSLESVLRRERGIPTTFLLYGPSGCGKTTAARIIAKMLKGDVKELNISKQGGINEARDIIEKSRYKSLSGKSKVIILNECHMANTKFWNAMLEILEEPPEDVYYILCTTEPSKLLPAVLTRCTQCQFSKLTSRDMTKLLINVLIMEGFEEQDVNDLAGVIAEITRKSLGSPRSALVMLDSIIDLDSIEEMEEAAENLHIGEATILELCKLLKNASEWRLVSKALSDIRDEPEDVRGAVLGFFSKELLATGDTRSAYIIELFKESFMWSRKAGLILACYYANNVDNEN